MNNLTYSLALKQAKKELERVNYRLLDTRQISVKTYLFLETPNIEATKNILICIYAIFLVILLLLYPLKLVICFCIILHRKNKHKKIFLEENSNESQSVLTYNSNDSVITDSEKVSSIQSNFEISTVQKSECEGDTKSLILSLMSLKNEESFHGSLFSSDDDSILNEKNYDQELNRLADLYGNFCAYLSYNHTNVHIPLSRHFLEWLFIKQTTCKE